MSTQKISKIKRRPPEGGICYVAPDVAIPSPRGSSVHVAELAENLVTLGCEVHVVCRRIKKSEPSLERINEVYVHRVYRWIFWPEKISSFAEDSTKVTKYSRAGRFYYLYLRTIFMLYVAFLSARIVSKFKLGAILERETSFGAGAITSALTGARLVLEIIGPRYSRLSIWRSSKILYYTESMLRGWVDRQKCLPIPAGVNISLFNPDSARREITRKKIGIELDAPVLGYVGTFQDWHGVDTIICAVTAVQQGLPDVKVVLVGPGFGKYEELARKMGVGERCIFTGPVNYTDVPDYINACDIMLAPYNPTANPLRRKYGIGWPIKILEYMACCKPVISTTVKPIDSLIPTPKLGRLIEPGNCAQLSCAIEELASSPELRSSIGKNGRALVEARYSWLEFAKLVSSLAK